MIQKSFKKIFMLIILGMIFSVCAANIAKAAPATLTVLQQSVTAWVRNFNPFVIQLEAARGFTYEPLVIYNGMNSEEIPWLAEEINLQDDMKTIILKVRKGVKWNDGETFDADDVVFNFTYPKDHPEIDSNGLWGDTGRLESVEKIDDYTVKFVMKEKNVFGKSNLFNQIWMVPEHIWKDIKEPTKVVVKNPIATGPFTQVERFSPQLFVMGRNPYYWDSEQLKIDRMMWPQYNSNDAAYDMLQSGKVDWAHIFIPQIDQVYVAGDETKKYWFPSHEVLRIALNMHTSNEGARKAFNNVNFRKAFSNAMDRKSMAEIGSYGYVKTGTPASGLNVALSKWRNPEADKIWSKYEKYDIKQAKKELADGGFKDIDHDGYVENPDGSKLEFTVDAPSGWTDWVNSVQIAVEGLRKIGINANVRTPELGMFVESWATDDFDGIMCGVGGIIPNIHRFYEHTMSPKFFYTRVWWSSNVSKYENKERDELINKLKVTQDEAEQKKIVDRIEMIHAEEIPYIPLYNNGNWFVYNTSRFEGWASSDNPYIDPAIAEHDDKLYHVLHLKPKK